MARRPHGAFLSVAISDAYHTPESALEIITYS
jgi:hypothetical protein